MATRLPYWVSSSFSMMDQLLNQTICVPQILDNEEYGRAFRDGYVTTVRFVISRGASAELAEEIAQAAWVAGWEHRFQLRDPDRIGFWINSIAKNLLARHFQRLQRTDALVGEAAGEVPGIEHLDVTSILERCPDSERMLLMRYYLEGQTTKEIAEHAGVSATAIRVRLLRVRRAVRSRLYVAAAALRRRPALAADSY